MAEESSEPVLSRWLRRGARAAASVDDEGRRQLRAAIAAGRTAGCTAAGTLSAATDAARATVANASAAATAAAAKGREALGGAVREYPEGLIVGSAVGLHWTLFGRSRVATAAYAGAATLALRHPLRNKWYDAEAAAAAAAAAAEANAAQSAAVRSALHRLRRRIDAAADAVAAASAYAEAQRAAAAAAVTAERRRAATAAAAAVRDAPEGFVGFVTLLFCTGRGAANGTMLGASPRGGLLVLAATSFALRDKLAAKWGSELLKLSEAVASRARAAARTDSKHN